MSNVETRHVNRDSLFLLAQLRVEGQDDLYRVKVRNLSAGGMMAEGPVPVQRGQQVAVELRNIGWVDGSVAWKQDDRFGIAFLDEIDPARACGIFSPGPRRHQPGPQGAPGKRSGNRQFAAAQALTAWRIQGGCKAACSAPKLGAWPVECQSWHLPLR